MPTKYQQLKFGLTGSCKWYNFACGAYQRLMITDQQCDQSSMDNLWVAKQPNLSSDRKLRL